MNLHSTSVVPGSGIRCPDRDTIPLFPCLCLGAHTKRAVTLDATALSECAHPECLTIQDERLSSVSLALVSVARFSLSSIGYRDLACQNSLRGGVYGSYIPSYPLAGCGWVGCTFHDGKSSKPCNNLFVVVGVVVSCFDTFGGSCAAPDLASSSILGPPSLSVAFINRVLSAYHSPAAGLGSVLYADSLTYGIDDAYPLAFFLHESSMGNAGWAKDNHSLGNIRCTAGWSCGGGYRSYATWAAGFHDWFALMVSEYLPRHLSTIATIIPVYAPSADHNDEHAYITAVLSAVSAWRTGRVLV